MPQVSPRDTYLQIVESLREQIANRKFKDDKLPSKAELRETYGVGGSTIDRALAVLKAEGLIESVQGDGVYVAGTGDRRPLVEQMTDILREPGTKVGDDFPTEEDLCQRFGKSRIAVRSAIAKMEGQGLIAKGTNRRREVRALPSAISGS